MDYKWLSKWSLLPILFGILPPLSASFLDLNIETITHKQGNVPTQQEDTTSGDSVIYEPAQDQATFYLQKKLKENLMFVPKSVRKQDYLYTNENGIAFIKGKVAFFKPYEYLPNNKKQQTKYGKSLDEFEKKHTEVCSPTIFKYVRNICLGSRLQEYSPNVEGGSWPCYLRYVAKVIWRWKKYKLVYHIPNDLPRDWDYKLGWNYSGTDAMILQQLMGIIEKYNHYTVLDDLCRPTKRLIVIGSKEEQAFDEIAKKRNCKKKVEKMSHQQKIQHLTSELKKLEHRSENNRKEHKLGITLKEIDSSPYVEHGENNHNSPMVIGERGKSEQKKNKSSTADVRMQG